MEAQLERLVDGVHDVLKGHLVGAYLHGSAVLGGLKKYSDIDVLAVIKRRTTRDQKRGLIDILLQLSGKPRPLELDVVVHSEVKPWRYPPRFDFHYSELWRGAFESGNLEPWLRDTNEDLAPVVTMALLGDAALFGPPPAEVFDPVPRRDYIDAILRDAETVDDHLAWNARNVVLTLPRIWSAIATDAVHSKDSAAAWALPRLPEEHRRVLERVRAVYRGEAEDESLDDILPQVRAYADHLVSEIERAAQKAS